MSELVVITTDDLEPAVRLRGAFEQTGWQVELLTAGETLRDVRGEPALLVITDVHAGERVRRLATEAAALGRLPIIGLISGDGGRTRDDCRRLGVSECIAHPIDHEEVVLVGRRLAQREQLRELTGIVGETDVMEEVLERVVQMAAVDSTVLIQGESGTGKELLARGLHALSSRRHRPFIAVNVAALPETLLESELFGHEKGAFTGAASLRKGLFELANSGTIFLDEIGEMPLATQTKLLRVLEEREFRRVGGEDTIRVDVRVITATNRRLRDQVDLGEFRRDLYHRLNVLRIELPALRERREDIPRLVDTFVREFVRQSDRPFPGIGPEAMRILVDYDWPGNVRELRNLVESMVVLAPNRTIRPEDIPAEVRGARRSLLPVHVPARKQDDVDADAGRAAELDFVIRTLFDLRLDVEDLKREMDRFRERESAMPPLQSFHPVHSLPGVPPLDPRQPPEEEQEAVEEGTVVYRPGMTMEDLEREAIRAALRNVDGNRRRAAEELGIGERTLYRKIKEYALD